MLRFVLCERLKQSNNTLSILEKCWVIFLQLLQVANHYAHAIKGVNKSRTDVFILYSLSKGHAWTTAKTSQKMKKWGSRSVRVNFEKHHPNEQNFNTLVFVSANCYELWPDLLNFWRKERSRPLEFGNDPGSFVLICAEKLGYFRV